MNHLVKPNNIYFSNKSRYDEFIFKRWHLGGSEFGAVVMKWLSHIRVLGLTPGTTFDFYILLMHPWEATEDG